jgi:hypothetical protein
MTSIIASVTFLAVYYRRCAGNAVFGRDRRDAPPNGAGADGGRTRCGTLLPDMGRCMDEMYDPAGCIPACCRISAGLGIIASSSPAHNTPQHPAAPVSVLFHPIKHNTPGYASQR